MDQTTLINCPNPHLVYHPFVRMSPFVEGTSTYFEVNIIVYILDAHKDLELSSTSTTAGGIRTYTLTVVAGNHPAGLISKCLRIDPSELNGVDLIGVLIDDGITTTESNETQNSKRDKKSDKRSGKMPDKDIPLRPRAKTVVHKSYASMPLEDRNQNKEEKNI